MSVQRIDSVRTGIQRIDYGIYRVPVFAVWSEPPSKSSFSSPDWVGIRSDVAVAVLNDALKLSEHFNLDDDFSKSVKQMLKTYYLIDDAWFWFPFKRSLHLWEIIELWEKFKEQNKIHGDWMHSIDCDDFARLFQEYCNFWLRVNTVFRIWGVLVIEEQGRKEYCGHAYNVLLLPTLYDYNTNTCIVNVVVFEPQTSEAQLPDKDGLVQLDYGDTRLTYKSYVVLG